MSTNDKSERKKVPQWVYTDLFKISVYSLVTDSAAKIEKKNPTKLLLKAHTNSHHLLRQRYLAKCSQGWSYMKIILCR